MRKLERTRKIQLAGQPTHYRGSVKIHTRKGVYNVAVIMLNHMGNVDSAQQTTQAIQDLQPAHVMMLGIAAGVKGRINLGDVLIADQIFYYEEQKQKPKEREARPRSFPVDPYLLDRAKNYNEVIWHDLLDSARPMESESASMPSVHFAPAAVGEKIVADQAVVNKLQRIHGKIAGIEMESFGVALAAANSFNRPRFLAIRGISDFANSQKNNDWHEYAADVAASFAIGFLRSGPVESLARVLIKERNANSLVAIRHQTMEPLLAHDISDSLPESLRHANTKEFLIDATDLYHNGQLSAPLEAARRQTDLVNRLTNFTTGSKKIDIAYYGIAHIPLVFLAGYQLSNKPKIYVLEHNRKSNDWDQLQTGGNYPEITVEGMPRDTVNTRGDLVIRISISYPVTEEAIAGIVSSPIASLHLGIQNPKIDVVTSEEQLIRYSTKFRDLLDTVHNRFPNAMRLHIFYAGPVSLAFCFGRLISKTIHPRVIVYNYSFKDVPFYSWGIEITGNVSEAEFLVRTKIEAEEEENV